MTIGAILTEGLGLFGGNLIVTLGYSLGDQAPTPPVPPPEVQTLKPSGGFPGDSGPTKEQRKRSRILFGLEPEEAAIVEAVAERQVADTSLDEQQKLDELRGEMQIRGLEMQSQHIQALNEEREHRMDLEIGRLLKLKIDEDDQIMLMLMMAAL